MGSDALIEPHNGRRKLDSTSSELVSIEGGGFSPSPSNPAGRPVGVEPATEPHQKRRKLKGTEDKCNIRNRMRLFHTIRLIQKTVSVETADTKGYSKE